MKKLNLCVKHIRKAIANVGISSIYSLSEISTRVNIIMVLSMNLDSQDTKINYDQNLKKQIYFYGIILLMLDSSSYCRYECNF